MTNDDRILIIKLSALGDFAQALGPIAALRRHHAAAHLTLLTTPPIEALARRTGYFEEVWLDSRPRWWRIGGWLALRARLRGGRFRRVYDLQTSDRSGVYFQLLRPGRRPEWSGIARGCSHPHDNPGRTTMHNFDRQAEQLRLAGVADVPPPDLGWARADISRFRLGPRYALLVPGSSARRLGSRWPAERYAELGRRLGARGIEPLLIGGPDQPEFMAGIAAAIAGGRNLAGHTTHEEIAVLGRGAAHAVGNDTGPMHLIAASGCPTLMLFSDATKPARCAPPGPAGRFLLRSDLAELSVDEVEAAMALDR